MPDSIDLTSLSKEEILDFAKPTKEYEKLMKIWPPLRIDWSNHTSAISKLRTQTEVADEMDEPDPAVKENIHKFSSRDGYELSLRVFRSVHSSIPGPAIVLYHGGGWCMGSTTMCAGIARDLVKKFKAVVIAPKYRLAPEYVWPASINDGWDALTYIRKNNVTFEGVDIKKGFVIGGISAGASMSWIYAHMARDEWLEEDGPRITGIWSACGSARIADTNDLEEAYQERLLSRTQDDCIKNPIMSPEMQRLMRDCVKADEKSQWYNCLLWKEGNKSSYGHAGLPRVYQQLCGRDVSRDEGLILDDMLKKESVETRLDLYKGLPHCFWIALSHVPEFKRWERDTMSGFEWLLQKS